MLADGQTVTMNALHKWGPKNCFYEYDLYSTHFGTMVNDEVEKYLFGSIDVRGATAVRAFADGDPCATHDSFQDFFEYLDAQKLRTPKGDRPRGIAARVGFLNLAHRALKGRPRNGCKWVCF